MARLIYDPAAVEDLYEIWRFVGQESQSVAIADRLVEAIDLACRSYSKQPLMGHERPDLAELIRCFSVERYVVLYSPLPDGIHVLQVIHGARDIPMHYRR